MVEFFVVYNNFLPRYRSFFNVRASNSRIGLVYRCISFFVSLSFCVLLPAYRRSLFHPLLHVIAAIIRAVCIGIGELENWIFFLCVIVEPFGNSAVFCVPFISSTTTEFSLSVVRVNISYTHTHTVFTYTSACWNWWWLTELHTVSISIHSNDLYFFWLFSVSYSNILLCSFSNTMFTPAKRQQACMCSPLWF